MGVYKGLLGNDIDGLSTHQWRTIFETLCDGDKNAVMPLTYIKQFKDCIEIFFWLRRNRVQGRKLVEFFRDKGNLNAVQYIRGRVQGRRFTSEKLNASDLV